MTLVPAGIIRYCVVLYSFGFTFFPLRSVPHLPLSIRQERSAIPASVIGIPYSRLGSFLAKRIRAFHSGDLSGNRVTRPADLSGDLGPGQTFLDQVSKFLRILFGPRSHLLNSNHFQGPRTRLNAPLQNGADMALRDIVLAAELVRSACAMHGEGQGGDGVCHFVSPATCLSSHAFRALTAFPPVSLVMTRSPISDAAMA